ncbi:MAG: preprotein translocase subunit SecE [Clostridiales bacterium]|jgi:preprotein translocase subunit SecE|nr:preprotein translocase subunit SecE [Clostridiales bacterium]
MEDKKKEIKEKSEGGFSEWFSGIMGEFKRITWPDRKSLIKMTVTVIITSGIFGGIIVLYDFVLAAGYDALVALLG